MIIVSAIGRKLVRIVAVLVVIAGSRNIADYRYNVLSDLGPGGMGRREHPSGNPLRVERKQNVEGAMSNL